MAAIIIQPIENLKHIQEKTGDRADTGEIVDRAVTKIGLPAVKYFTSCSDEQAEYLVQQKPALVSAFMVVLIFFLPFLVCLGAFNQTAGDIANRGLRYQLLRTERVNIFIGRFIGTYVFTLMVIAGLMAVVMLYLIAKARFYDAGDVIGWMLRGYLTMAVYALPWVALCSWVSTFIDSAFGALVIALLMSLMYPVIVYLASKSNAHLSFLQYFSPWGYKWWLLHPDIGKFFAGTGVMFGFTGLFGWLGLSHFQKRDL